MNNKDIYKNINAQFLITGGDASFFYSLAGIFESGNVA